MVGGDSLPQPDVDDGLGRLRPHRLRRAPRPASQSDWTAAGGTDDIALRPDPVAVVKELARRWRWRAAAVAVVLLILGLAFGGQASWGDVATWVLAVIALAVLFAATFAGLMAYELLRVELGRDHVAAEERRLSEDERRRGQASLVAAWFGKRQGIEPFLTWGAIISNASPLPVYDVRVSFCVAVPAASGLTWRQGERYSSPDLIHVLAPGEHHAAIPSDIFRSEDVFRPEDAGGKTEWLVAIEFTDASGQRWVRDPSGGLRPA